MNQEVSSEDLVIISGANGGLGQSLCQEYLNRGFSVMGLVRSEQKAKELLFRLDRTEKFQSRICDVTNLQDCQILSEELAGKPVCTLINNAGITSIKTFQGLDDVETTRKVIEVNLLGAIQLTGALLDNLKSHQSASIINISSVLGFAPVYGRTAYAASKFGMEGFFRTLHTELKDFGVYNLMVYPTFISTGIRTEEMNTKTSGKILTPEFCAEKIAKTHQKRKKRTLLLGSTAKQSYWIYKFAPRLYERLMLKNMKAKVER